MRPNPPASLDAVPAATGRFHVPFEHGAWWSFGSCLVGGLGVALYRQADPWACGGLSVSLASGFVAQDWGQALIGRLLGRRSQALSQWQAPQGWALGILSMAGALLLIGRLDAQQRLGWLLLLGLLGAASAAGLAGRVLQSGRGRKSLAATALLLAGPALPFGALAYGLAPRAFLFWAWPLAFYPAATLAAQSFIRGFPERARWAGPLLAALLAALALGLGAWAPGLVLAVQAARLHYAIRQRWRLHPQGLPPGNAIRAFGREQAFFGVTLTLLWALAFARL